MIVTCPHCGTETDTDRRCTGTERGGLRCVEMSGHPGWHWADLGGSKVVRWTGVARVVGCYGHRDLLNWCSGPPGHKSLHRDGQVSFCDPEVEVSTA